MLWCSWWLSVLICSKNHTSCKVCSGCTSAPSLQHLVDEHPFTAYVRIKPKMFRKKLPSLYFFIYLYKINSRSLEIQVCPYPWTQANSWEFKPQWTKPKHPQVLQLQFCRQAHGICKRSSLTPGVSFRSLGKQRDIARMSWKNSVLKLQPRSFWCLLNWSEITF